MYGIANSLADPVEALSGKSRGWEVSFELFFLLNHVFEFFFCLIKFFLCVFFCRFLSVFRVFLSFFLIILFFCECFFFFLNTFGLTIVEAFYF